MKIPIHVYRLSFSVRSAEEPSTETVAYAARAKAEELCVSPENLPEVCEKVGTFDMVSDGADGTDIKMMMALQGLNSVSEES